ncbi:unnamed protein product [Ascophyllum nodosum]
MAAYIDGMPANGRIAELVELARRTTSRLAILWEEVGYSDEEKGRQMEGLIDGFRTLCENKERQENDVKNQFITSIADAKDRIKKAREILGQEHEEGPSANGTSLTDQLAHVEMEAESLKKMRIAQQEKFLKLSEEIIHMSVVLGEDSDANLAEWRDVETCLTEERRLAFTQKKNELNRAMEDRMTTIISLVTSIQELMEELKITASTPLDNRILGSLAIPSASGVPVLQTAERTASSTGIDRNALDELCARQEELLNQRNARREKLEKMGEEILDLWQQLDIGKDEQDAFAASVDGMGLQTLEAGETELARLRKLKKERMGDLVRSKRAKIRELWDGIGCSEAERLAFKPMLVTEEGFTEQLLQQHTQEADNLNAKFETMRHILEKIEEREALVEQRFDNETSKKDPSRFMAKGNVQERRQLQKRLQQELEAEKRIKNRLPVLTSSLSKIIHRSLPEAMVATVAPYLITLDILRYLDVMQRSEDEFAALKDQIKAAKDAKKKEELWKLAMVSPAAKASNTVVLARGETPRGNRKPSASHRKAVGSGATRAPRTPKQRAGSADRDSASAGIITPERNSSVGRESGSSEMPDTTITDVSNQIENVTTSSGETPKQRTSSGRNEDSENSTSTSPLETSANYDA